MVALLTSRYVRNLPRCSCRIVCLAHLLSHIFIKKLISEEEQAERRRLQAEAAEKRSKDFKQGGGKLNILELVHGPRLKHFTSLT